MSKYKAPIPVQNITVNQNEAIQMDSDILFEIDKFICDIAEIETPLEISFFDDENPSFVYPRANGHIEITFVWNESLECFNDHLNNPLENNVIKPLINKLKALGYPQFKITDNCYEIGATIIDFYK